MQKEIPVFFAADDKYVPYTTISILSMLDYVNRKDLYRVFILHTGISAENRQKLEALSTQNVIIKCTDVVHEMKNRHIHIVNERLPAESAYRLLIPELFPQYEKILYLDSDIIVLRDVAELYATDIGDCVLGAASDQAEERNMKPSDASWQHVLSIGVPPADYFNAGIVLINTQRFKELQIAEKCFALLCGEHNCLCLDQDALNIHCHGYVHFLDKKWNALLYPGLSPTEYYIIHYAGTKPWEHFDVPLSDFFWKYAEQTHYMNMILRSYVVGNISHNNIYIKEFNQDLLEYFIRLSQTVEKLAGQIAAKDS